MRGTTERLMEEHDQIIGFLNTLFRGIRLERQGVLLGIDFWKDAIHFIRNFSDNYHHAKEEKILFPAYCDKGMQVDYGPVAVMLRDHEHFRSAVALIEESLEQGEAGNEGRWLACDDFIESLRFHIHKENNILYPMGEDILSEEDEVRLMAAFDEAEEELGSDVTEEEFKRLAESLEKRVIEAFDKGVVKEAN